MLLQEEREKIVAYGQEMLTLSDGREEAAAGAAQFAAEQQI